MCAPWLPEVTVPWRKCAPACCLLVGLTLLWVFVQSCWPHVDVGVGVYWGVCCLFEPLLWFGTGCAALKPPHPHLPPWLTPLACCTLVLALTLTLPTEPSPACDSPWCGGVAVGCVCSHCDCAPQWLQPAPRRFGMLLCVGWCLPVGVVFLGCLTDECV